MTITPTELDQAIKNLEDMPMEEFEKLCIEAGHIPERKPEHQTCDKSIPDLVLPKDLGNQTNPNKV